MQKRRNISYGSTQQIVVHVLGMKRVAARHRVEVAKEILANVADDPTFIKRIITSSSFS